MNFFSRLQVVVMAGVFSLLIVFEVGLSQERRRPVVSEPAEPTVSEKVRDLPVMNPPMAVGPVREIPRQVGEF